MTVESKQERMNRQREENRNVVRATIAYDCGNCGHTVRVDVEPDENGLIFIPDAFCGSCSKHMNFRPVSGNIVKMEVKTAKEWKEIDNTKPEQTDDDDAGTTTTEPPKKTEKAGSKNKTGRKVDKG